MVFEPLSEDLIFVSDLVYTVLTVVFCYAIYFKTKEIYELTKYEGIRYFRSAFMFLGVSFVLRFLFGLLMFSREVFDIFVPRRVLTPIFILLLGYLSTVAILYLVYSTIWKKFSSRIFIAAAHVVAALLAVVSFATHSHVILLFMQAALLIVSLVMSLLMHRKHKKLSQIQVLYFLMFVFWVINLFFVGPRPGLPFALNELPQLISLGIFFIIYYKVSKWAR